MNLAKKIGYMQVFKRRCMREDVTDKRANMKLDPLSSDEGKGIKDGICLLSESPYRILKVAANGNLKEFDKLYTNDNSRLNIQDSKGKTPLHHAVLKKRLNIINFVLDHNGDLNRQDKDGNTALHLAVENSTAEILEILLSHNANTSILNDQNMAPIHIACLQGHAEALEVMVKFDSIEVDLVGENGQTPLHFCTIKDKDECARVLLDSGAKLFAKCAHGKSPVHTAAKYASPKCLEVFMKSAEARGCTREEVLLFEDKEHNTPLHTAVNSGDLEAVKVCIKVGAPVDAQQVDKSTPLHFACSQGNLKMVQMMATLQHERFCNALFIKDVLDMVPLHRAAQYNHVDVVEYLLEQGADCNSTDSQNRTPMLLAASKSGLQTVKTLIDHGADIQIKDKHNRNFLHSAIKFGGPICISEQNACLQKFVNQLNEQDDFGCTPLHYASKAGYLTAIGDLLKLGAHINPKNKDNKSPFHFAARYGRYNTCLKLLNSAHGSTIINETDGNSQTGLHIAAENGHNRVVALLLERGAVVTRDATGNSPMQLAAANGYTKCIHLLLKYHSNLLECENEDGDTPLHVAAKHGQPRAVKLFMSNEAKFSKNKEGYTFIDHAIENMQTEVALEIIRHDRWEEVLALEGCKLGCIMPEMVEVMPDVCMAVLDRCKVPSKHDPRSKEYHVTYNFKYLQCSLDAIKWMKKRGHEIKPMITLNRMVQFGRVNCLSHPVISMYLKMKWKAYGWWVYMLNFLIYAVFLAMLTYFGTSTTDYKSQVKRGHSNGTFEMADGPKELDFAEKFDNMQKTSLLVVAIFCILNSLKEFFQMYQQKLKYFLDPTNLLEWVLYISASIFIFPMFACQTTETQWNAAAIAMFLAWLNCLLYLQRFDFFGLYVVMFLEILRTLLQVVFVFSILFVAFGLSFYILLSEEESKAYSSPGLAIIRSGVMMLDLDYMDSFNRPLNDDDPHTLPLSTLTMIQLVVFILLMPILLINLMIGLAVGDIESVQRNARLKRLAMQVELHTEFERKLPHKLLEMVDKVTYTVYPNKGEGWLRNVVDRLTSAAANSDPTSDRVTPENQFLMEEMLKQKKKMKDISQTLRKQHEFLRLIIQKMEIHTEDDNQDEGGYSTEDQTCGDLVQDCGSDTRHDLMKSAVLSKWKGKMA